MKAVKLRQKYSANTQERSLILQNSNSLRKSAFTMELKTDLKSDRNLNCGRYLGKYKKWLHGNSIYHSGVKKKSKIMYKQSF